jgi:serine/threonine-protein kinase
MALTIGDHVGDYEVVALIGAGGMGRVYKVRNIISNREEAMKILLPDLTSERDLAVRFMLEIRTLAGLDHPNIAQLRTAFQFQNQLVMIMEFVEGVTLEKLATDSPIPVNRVLDFATQALSALSFAHTHGVIHRDIKPANIMVTTHSQVKLMDFGIAKNADEMHLTRPGMTIGSVYYMSPEQVRGGTVDARSDLYSFGITLYELLTGRKPFQADTSYSVLNAQLNEAPIPPIQVNPALPAQLNAIVLRSLEKNPEARFQTAQEFHDALKALVETAAPHAAPVSAAPQAFAPVPGYAESLSATTAGLSSAAAPNQAAQAAPPAFAPVAAAVPIAQPAAKSHRGLWIGLGALAAVLALVAIAVVLPHVYSTYAKQRAALASPAASSDTPAAVASAQPVTPPATTPTTDATPTPDAAAASTPVPNPAAATASSAPAAQPAAPMPQGKPTARSASSEPAQHRASYANSPSPAGQRASAAIASAGSGGAPAASAPSVPAGPSPQEVRQVKDRLINLEARADAARSGVQSIRTQQQAQGLDIRGDILASMNRMNSDIREANSALAQNDLQAAAQYLDRADKETAKIETFLGR